MAFLIPLIVLVGTLGLWAAAYIAGRKVGNREPLFYPRTEHDISRDSIIADLRTERDLWANAYHKYRALYFAELEKPKLAAPVIDTSRIDTSRLRDEYEKLADPPTVGQADRRALERRQKEELIRRAPRIEPDADMEPVPLMDKSVAPPPRLNDRG
jgi:hypothetical protein